MLRADCFALTAFDALVSAFAAVTVYQLVPQIEAVEESGTAFSEVVEQVKIKIACSGLL